MYMLYLQVSNDEPSTEVLEEVDFDKAIAQQVDAEKSTANKIGRFQVVDSKTTNCVFIRTSLERPDDLLYQYLSDVASSGVTKSRFIMKIFPVLGTCRSMEDSIEQLVQAILQSWVAAGNSFKTYAILYKVRCNNLSREQLLPIVGRAIHSVRFECRVDLNTPDIVVSVDILGKFCCVSIMKDFYKLRKYNVQELAKLKSTPAVTDAADESRTAASASLSLTENTSEQCLSVSEKPTMSAEQTDASADQRN